MQMGKKTGGIKQAMMITTTIAIVFVLLGLLHASPDRLQATPAWELLLEYLVQALMGLFIHEAG
jgi:hypothetical protein